MSKQPALQVIGRILGEPWAITEPALREIIEIALRENELDPKALEAKLGRPLGNTRDVTVREGIATIPIEGPLFYKANLMTEISGATSFAQLALDITTALNDPTISALLLSFDSPGGQVNGTFELQRMILEAREKKRIEAYVGAQASSAAYVIASATSRVTMSPAALAGSIGAVLEVSVRPDADARTGIQRFQFISSQSPNKRADPRTPEGSAQFQRVADALGQLIVESVAANRGVTVDKVLTDFGGGGVFVGREAVARGLADAVSTYEEVHARLVADVRSGGRFPVSSTRMEAPVSAPTPPAAPAATTAPTRLARPQLESEYSAEVAAIKGDAAKAERERLTALDELAALKPGHADFISKAKADANGTAEKAALEIARAEQAKRDAKADALKGDEAKLDKPDANAKAPEAGSAAAEVQRITSLLAGARGEKIATAAR